MRVMICQDCNKDGRTIHMLKSGTLPTQIEDMGHLLYCAKCIAEQFDDIPEAATVARGIKRINGDWIKLQKEVQK